MSGSKPAKLRVGVVGLGRLWEARYKPALARMRDRFQVVAVYDQVPRRAEVEAGQLGCRPCEGVAELVGLAEVDAVYLLTPQWFGLHPVALACSAGKPIFCALPVPAEGEDLEALDRLVRSSGTPFMPEFARRSYPASTRLRELLATRLGAPRQVIALGRVESFDRYGQPGPSTQIAPAPLLMDPGGYLLDWCRFLFEGEPTAVQAWSGTVLPTFATGGPDYESFLAEFPGGAVAEVSVGRHHRAAWGDASRFLSQPGIQVFAERGAAWLEMPDRICWADADGSHDERLAIEPSIGEVLNDQFLLLSRGEPTTAPTWADSIAVARLLRTIRRSGLEGRKVATTPP